MGMLDAYIYKTGRPLRGLFPEENQDDIFHQGHQEHAGRHSQITRLGSDSSEV
jgi:hypothetical protein